MPNTMLQTRRKKVVLGPDDQGRSMSLDEFDRATAGEGHLYELNKGVVEVSNVPSSSHFGILQEIRDQLVVFRRSTAGPIHSIAGSMDSKILLDADQSERHPDLSVYLTPPPATKDIWSIWVPAIVVEVVSKTSIHRDYEEKPAEYAAFGIDEYWIVDPFKSRLTAMTRWRGTWKSKAFKPSQKYLTPILPGFVLDLAAVFEAGK